MRHSPSLLTSAAEDDDPACTIWYIRRRLGRGDYSGPRMARYLLLLQDHGFPPPFPMMRRKDGRDILIAEPTEASSWPRHAVDQWLDDFLPSDNAAAIDAAASAHAAGEMDQAAFGLQLVRGGKA